MSISEILNILLGGGLVTLIIALATKRATVRKANADAEKAKADADKARADAEKARADAEAVRITNTENATRILMENIVKPLKEELNATREDLQATKKQMASTQREMVRLRKAVEAASGCRHADYCPVLYKLRDNQKDATGSDIFDIREDRHDNNRDQTDHNACDPGEPGGSDNIRGQPP